MKAYRVQHVFVRDMKVVFDDFRADKLMLHGRADRVGRDCVFYVFWQFGFVVHFPDVVQQPRKQHFVFVDFWTKVTI